MKKIFPIPIELKIPDESELKAIEDSWLKHCESQPPPKSLTQYIIEDFFKKSENIHKKTVDHALEQYLKRKPIESDYLKCARLTCEDMPANTYVLAYDGVQLGAISFEIKNNPIDFKDPRCSIETIYYFDPSYRISSI